MCVSNLTRRKFKILGLTAGIATTSGIAAKSSRSGRKIRGQVRLMPLEGVTYSDSFQRFMERARFDSVREAVNCIRDRASKVRIVAA